MALTAPSPHTWIIRAKNHKRVVLLHVDPLASFRELKDELLRALRTGVASGKLDSGRDIPNDSNSILLARPVDINDYSKGWVRIHCEGEGDETAEVDEDMAEMDGKGKERMAAKKRGPAKHATPKAAGLREGSVIAFRLKDDPLATDMQGDASEIVGEQWDVVQPSYDDAEEGNGLDEAAEP